MNMFQMMMVALAVCTLALAGCDKKSSGEGAKTTPAPANTATANKETAPAATAPKAVAGDGEVEVAAKGTSFDPAVKKEQIPAGAWICDMGTVHYAAMEKGDGKCPRCAMNLVEHGAKAGADAPADGAQDHAHDGHEH